MTPHVRKTGEWKWRPCRKPPMPKRRFMNESDHREIADAPLHSSTDFNVLIASLRAAGADQFDPVRLHYIDALAKRAIAHQGSAKRMIDVKLAQALAAFKERF